VSPDTSVYGRDARQPIEGDSLSGRGERIPAATVFGRAEETSSHDALGMSG